MSVDDTIASVEGDGPFKRVLAAVDPNSSDRSQDAERGEE
jgi:hypothetical protein